MIRPGVLLSCAYYRTADIRRFVGEADNRPVIFADSGAFSPTKAPTREQYLDWIETWRAWFDVICTLDVIGDPKGTAKNTAWLEDRGVPALPVFHYASPLRELERMCARYRYVALGGLVPYTAKPKLLVPWLRRCTQITEAHDVAVHLLGMSGLRVLRAIRFHSSDSSAWGMIGRQGKHMLWDASMREWCTVFWHDPVSLLRAKRLLSAYGIDTAHAGTRDLMWRNDTTMAAARSWSAFQEYIEELWGTSHVEGTPDGPRIYLVCTNWSMTMPLASALFAGKEIA